MRSTLRDTALFALLPLWLVWGLLHDLRVSLTRPPCGC